ncbi:MAG: hypothetical protein ACLPN1_18630 [Dissulfurispiraceae bacterium]
MNNREKQAARAEKKQQKIESGFMASLFPGVASIVINMVYSQKGIRQPMPRTVNFFPNSYAFFRVDCLSKECVEGGFDFTRIITSMVGSRQHTSNGEFGCEGGPAEDHSAIVYDVAIQYI